MRTTKSAKNAPKVDAPSTRRCAIYARVSTDEQAMLEYNSLQAQEEICKNYIAIRASDPAIARKWVHAKTYTDAGFSGGTLERPALKLLLADVAEGKVDVIVAYKIDRISRSISQFYEVWNLLEEHEVDFASATQEFNTATSQGKLMLNLLLSFAQYERELIGERTRDKIAAARRNGRWCGGKPILGYDIDRERSRLVINESEAPIVRDIFQTYLEEMSLLRAIAAINEKGYRTKAWTTSAGHRIGGAPFDKVTLDRLLHNPTYIGKVAHHEKLYVGLHTAIVEEAVFERVQKLLAQPHHPHFRTGPREYEFLLQGLVRCGPCNRAMSPNHAVGRAKKKYFYYVCTRVTREGADACTVRSFSAPILEGLLLERLRELVADESLVEAIMSRAKIEAEARAPQIREERDRLQGELRRFKEESGRLVDAIATGTGGAELVAGRLQDAEDRLKTVEARLKELAAEEERLATAEVTPGQVRASLARFSELWQTLPQTQKTRLVRLVVQEVVIDHRDRLRTKITWRLRPFRTGAAMETRDEVFETRRFQRGGRDSNPRPSA